MRLEGTFSEITAKTIPVNFTDEGNLFYSRFGEVHFVKEHGGKVYKGDYVVTPSVESQTMETKDKVMDQDVTITAIPFFEVSNTSGGSTIYIAKEI